MKYELSGIKVEIAMQALSSYFSRLPIKQLKKGEIIFLQGDVPAQAFGIVSGVVRVYNLTTEGEQKCILYFVRDEILPICWLFSKADKTLFYYEAHTDCELVVIDKVAFTKELRHKPDLMHEVLQNQIGVYVQQMLRINSLEQPRAAVKLLNTFQLLCLRYGREIAEDVVRVELPLTQQEIANMTGLTRETTTIELKRLRDKGVISYQHKYYVVYTDLLNDLLDDEFDPGIHIVSC